MIHVDSFFLRAMSELCFIFKNLFQHTLGIFNIIFNFLRINPTTTLATLTFFELPLYHNVHHHVPSLICPFLEFLEILLCFHYILFPSLWLICFVSLKGLSANEQSLHIFLFLLSSILLNIGSCFVSILSGFNGKTSVSTKCNV